VVLLKGVFTEAHRSYDRAMGFPDALLLMFLALADGLVLAYLRLRRSEAVKHDRMARSLRFAVERETRESVPVPRWMLRRAS